MKKESVHLVGFRTESGQSCARCGTKLTIGSWGPGTRIVFRDGQAKVTTAEANCPTGSDQAASP